MKKSSSSAEPVFSAPISVKSRLNMATKSSALTTSTPVLSDDPKQSKPDNTLAKEELDWKPKIELEDGLVKTIEYFEGLLSPK